MGPLRWLALALVLGCAGPRKLAPPTAVPAAIAACDAHQTEILHGADARATPWSVARHLAKHFPDGRVAWLMKDTSYRSFVVEPAARKWGRCDDSGCYVFVAPAAVIHAAVSLSMINGRHDPEVLSKALGLPAARFEGPLRMMTLDLGKVRACVRLPVESDPGVWKCKTGDDTDCFKFGGYTSGGVPELMVIDAPVEQTAIEVVE